MKHFLISPLCFPLHLHFPFSQIPNLEIPRRLRIEGRPRILSGNPRSWPRILHPMAFANRNLTLSPDSADLDEDLDKLELEVMQMAQKISGYRKTLPGQLKNTLAAVLSSPRPLLSTIDSATSDLGPSRLTNPESEDPVVPATVPQLRSEEQQSSEKLIQLKERIARNMATLPTVVERMRECVDRIDELDSVNGTIHPAFRRQRTT